MSQQRNDVMWLLIILLAVVVAVPLLLWGFWGGSMSGMMGMMGGYGWGYGGSFMFIVPLAFLLLIALGIYFLVVGSAGTSRTTTSTSERALATLKERYARGELNEEEYLKMKKELES